MQQGESEPRNVLAFCRKKNYVPFYAVAKVNRERYRSHLSKCKQSKGVGLSNRTDQT